MTKSFFDSSSKRIYTESKQIYKDQNTEIMRERQQQQQELHQNQVPDTAVSPALQLSGTHSRTKQLLPENDGQHHLQHQKLRKVSESNEVQWQNNQQKDELLVNEIIQNSSLSGEVQQFQEICQNLSSGNEILKYHNCFPKKCHTKEQHGQLFKENVKNMPLDKLQENCSLEYENQIQESKQDKFNHSPQMQNTSCGHSSSNYCISIPLSKENKLHPSTTKDQQKSVPDHPYQEEDCTIHKQKTLLTEESEKYQQKPEDGHLPLESASGRQSNLISQQQQCTSVQEQQQTVIDEHFNSPLQRPGFIQNQTTTNQEKQQGLQLEFNQEQQLTAEQEELLRRKQKQAFTTKQTEHIRVGEGQALVVEPKNNLTNETETVKDFAEEVQRQLMEREQHFAARNDPQHPIENDRVHSTGNQQVTIEITPKLPIKFSQLCHLTSTKALQKHSMDIGLSLYLEACQRLGMVQRQTNTMEQWQQHSEEHVEQHTEKQQEQNSVKQGQQFTSKQKQLQEHSSLYLLSEISKTDIDTTWASSSQSILRCAMEIQQTCSMNNTALHMSHVEDSIIKLVPVITEEHISKTVDLSKQLGFMWTSHPVSPGKQCSQAGRPKRKCTLGVNYVISP